MPDIKLWAGWLLLRAVAQDLFQASGPASGGLRVSLGIPWLAAASFQASHGVLPGCPHIPFL